MDTGNDCLVCCHFEGLSAVREPIFFLFLVKCSTVLAHLQDRLARADLEIGSAVLLHGGL
jgi:hypothetical protein